MGFGYREQLIAIDGLERYSDPNCDSSKNTSPSDGGQVWCRDGVTIFGTGPLTYTKPETLLIGLGSLSIRAFPDKQHVCVDFELGRPTRA